MYATMINDERDDEFERARRVIQDDLEWEKKRKGKKLQSQKKQ